MLGIITILSSIDFFATALNVKTQDIVSKDSMEDEAIDEDVTTSAKSFYIWSTSSNKVIRDFSPEQDGIFISEVEGDSVKSTNFENSNTSRMSRPR